MPRELRLHTIPSMSDYSKLVKAEAKAFYDACREEFSSDSEEFGGKSEAPNLMKWIDQSGALSKRVEEVSSKWTPKEFRWVKSHTRNKAPDGGDPRSHAFASFLQDVRHEVKKLAKK